VYNVYVVKEKELTWLTKEPTSISHPSKR